MSKFKSYSEELATIQTQIDNLCIKIVQVDMDWDKPNSPNNRKLRKLKKREQELLEIHRNLVRNLNANFF